MEKMMFKEIEDYGIPVVWKIPLKSEEDSNGGS
jgi:hypothetical protein